ncbi:DNA methyltransferase, partial [Persephonella sp.]
QIDHQAMFPEELPRRIIKMFSFVGETVLDPFLGSGTTSKVALELGRNAIGYEINEEFLKIINQKMATNRLDMIDKKIEIIKRDNPAIPEDVEYTPRIKDTKPVIEPKKLRFGKDNIYKVIDILEDGKLKLDTGLIVKLKGIVITDLDKAISYLKQYVLKKGVYLKFDKGYVPDKDFVEAYVYLKNKIFINTYLLKSGLATVDMDSDFDLKSRFIKVDKHAKVV